VEQFGVRGLLHFPKLRMRNHLAGAADQRDARHAKIVVAD
jgi:hypothetical protein